ncbi:hypothetical protein DL96DRAFT_1592408 [Flagelloscypha sp. PMI_526]|nr:hypothetical protein DL96DRAFT_1592408 [Flagelloscypha sp. PMI_526]
MASSSSAAFSLENILEHPTANGTIDDPSEDTNVDATPPPEGYCIECEDQPAEVFCENCSDAYCQVCFDSQHRKGTRKTHVVKSLPAPGSSPPVSSTPSNGKTHHQKDVSMEEDILDSEDDGEEWHGISDSAAPTLGSEVGEWFVERSKYIPLRLTLGERKFLRLLEAALSVSEYTDKIDTLSFGLSKAKRIVQQIRELCAIMSGLVLAADYKQGQELFTDKDFEANSEFFQDIFELGRRHKIMNPDKMRHTYGKLIYLLQDSQSPEVKQMLGFSCVRPMKTVHSILEEAGLLDMLRDKLITAATMEILAPPGRPRRDIQKDIKLKERAIEQLSIRYAKQSKLSRDQISQCLYFHRVNRDPCEKMIEYLKAHFHPNKAESNKLNLSIRNGKGGSRLSHDHGKQYSYVLQSLTLWREILFEICSVLWSMAEHDLLNESIPYRLRDTGQGLNRVQQAPKTSRLMHSILHKAQTNIGHWVGSSVIHVGDHTVPSAFHLLDKYTQVYRILLPVCNTLQQIPPLADSTPSIKSYIEDEFGSVDGAIREILCDFFRHGFDGSGADSYYDAGSCIDGRLTSAWNWCSLIAKKRYYPLFLLTGFVSFDGDW